MSSTPPGPLARSNYLSWPPGPYEAAADPNSAAFNPASVLPAAGIVSYGDAALDAEQYLRPLERLHGMGMHSPGVAFGLQIKATTGHVGVTIMPGLALDAAGRHIYLAAGGSAEIGPTAGTPGTPPNLAPVTAAGVTLPTTGLTGTLYVVAQWRETFDSATYASDPNISQYNDTPWLQLVTLAGYLPDLHVVLGKVVLDASAKVSSATYGDPGALQRTLVGLPAQGLYLQRAVTTPAATPGADNNTTWGAVRAREAGGVEIAVAKSSDHVQILNDAGGNFSTLGVGANTASFGDQANPGISLIGSEATIMVGAPGNYGDVLVHDGSSHLVVSLVGDTAHVVVGGETLPGKVRMMNAQAKDTLWLDGDLGSAVVHRLGAFANNTIDVDTGFLYVHATDLCLDGRSKKNNRALVDYNNLLVINFAGDYVNGVQINSGLKVDDNLNIGGSLVVNGAATIGESLKVDGVLYDVNGTPLMGNPARKTSWTLIAAGTVAGNGMQSRTFAQIDLQKPRQFSAYCMMANIDSTSDFDYDNGVSVEVYAVDGVKTGQFITGGGWGNPGDDINQQQPFVSSYGRYVTFRLTALGPDLFAAAVGIVFYE